MAGFLLQPLCREYTGPVRVRLETRGLLGGYGSCQDWSVGTLDTGGDRGLGEKWPDCKYIPARPGEALMDLLCHSERRGGPKAFGLVKNSAVFRDGENYG